MSHRSDDRSELKAQNEEAIDRERARYHETVCVCRPLRDYTDDFERLRGLPLEETEEQMRELTAEIATDAAAEFAARAKAVERLPTERRERLLDEQTDVLIDMWEDLAAPLPPEERCSARSIPLLEQLLRAMPPEMIERMAHRRRERGLPPLMGIARVIEGVNGEG